MRARSTIVLLAGAGALAAGLASNVGAQGQGQGQGTDRTIVLYEKADEDNFRFVDAKPFTRVGRRGPRRISPGDAFFVRGGLYPEPTAAARSATVFGSCRAANPARRFPRVTWLCDGSVRFPDGTLEFQGLFRDADEPLVFAITGGTRAYEGARGQVTIEDQPGGGSKDTIHLLADK